MGPWIGVLLLFLPLLPSAQLNAPSQPEATPILELTPTSSATNTSNITETEPSPSLIPTLTAKPSSEDDWSAAENYLYTADSSSLAASTCTRTFQLPVQRGSPPPVLPALLQQAVASLTNAANFLNLIFQASELREMSVREDIEWYHALVRALLEGDRPGLVRRAYLTFDADPTIQQPQLVLHASKGSTQDILLQDLTSSWSIFLPPAPDQSWFNRFKSSSPPLNALFKRVLLNDLSTLDTPKWARGDSYVFNSSGVQWGDGPFLECVNGRFMPGWLLSLSMPFYGLKPDLSPEFRGVIRVDVNIQGFPVDQCASGDFWFANTHQCNRTSMECESSPQQGFRMGQYCCRCKKGFYSPVPRKTSKRKTKMNSTRACYPELPVCLPCWPGCVQCKDGNPCWVQEDWLLRSGVLAVQGLLMVLVLISMLAAYQCRRTKRIRSSGLLLLEMILCGSLLLYFPVFILYFKPSTFRCILLRWVRLLGFAVVYGTVTLKIYRVLKVFLSRTAQRVPYITTTGVLRMLGVMVLTVSWFLCAWTVGVLQNRDRNVPLLIVSTTSEGQGFRVCDLDRWDYMMAVAEMLFLCWGIFLCSAVKTVPSAFHEPRYMSIAIHNELLLSSLFHLLRFFRPSIHPDWMLMLFFIHTHVTITVTLGLLFIPKFLHISRPGQEEIAAEVYEDEVDLRRSCSYLNSSFTSNCWSDQSLDPDDIRDELKKLYSQLEVNKTKRMANSNPHLPKKRSSRLSIGRSIIKRITEIPESLSRQCSREDKDISAAIGTITRTASYYKSHPSASINTVNESLMQPSPKLRKSHSAYDCGPETDPATLLNSSIRGTEKRSSQISDAGSINTTLLICKSASAQNLSLDTNFLLPEPSRFQKSLSVIERNGHRSVTRSTENVTFSSKTFPAEKVQQNVDADIKRQTSSALLSESFDKAEVCPWEVPDEPANKNQKHVTYASSKEEEPKSPSPATSPSLLYVCPWEYLPPPTVPTKESAQSDGDSTKPKASISSSAPGSPHVVSEKPKEFRVFSFRSATQKLVAAKRMSEVGRTLSRERSINDDQVKQTTLQKSHSASVRLTPESAASDKRTPQPQRRAMTTIGTKPSLVKQIAVRLPSTESPERSPKHTAPVHICPWESEEVVIEVRKQSVNESLIQKQILQSSTLLAVPNPDVCPWDVPKPFHQTSVSEVCPWDVVEAEEVPSKSTRSDVCPWETDPNLGNSAVAVPVLGDAHKQTDVLNTNSPQIKQEHSKFLSDTSMKQDDTDFPAPPPPVIDISPWKSDSKDSLAEKAHICPWETEDSESSEAFKSATYRKPAGQHERVYANVGLWNAGEPEKPFQRAQEARVNVCPWETTGEPSGTVERTSVQPLETKQSMGTLQKQDSGRANVCPWETEEPTKTLQKQDSGRANVCPWETEEPTKTLQKQDSGRANVCPWETEEQTKTLQKQDSVRADVCPWETEEPTKTSQKQDSGRTNVCPWETEEPTKTLQKQDSVRADVCPWEKDEPTKSLQKQDSVRTNVCPWEAEEPKHTLQKQDSVRANVCPWEVEEPTKPLQKQDSIHADVCPWETEEQRNTLQTDGGSANVCPWEKQAPNTLQRERSSNVDVCPWETSEPIKTLQKQASVHSDICPWESNPSPKHSTPKRQDSGQERGDITPTHHSDPIIRTPEVNRVSLPLVRCDALCPWEMEGCRQDSVTRSNSDVFTWEETIPEEDDDAETAAEAFVFPPDL